MEWSTCTGREKKTADLRRKQGTIALAAELTSQTICCMTDSILGSLNDKVLLNQYVLAALELLQDLSEQGASANQCLDDKWNSKWQEKLFLQL